jgi:hypothetical protein
LCPEARGEDESENSNSQENGTTLHVEKPPAETASFVDRMLLKFWVLDFQFMAFM